MVKRQEKSLSENIEEEVAPPMPSYFALTAAQYAALKMRCRDYLDANKKMIDAEVAVQAAALVVSDKDRGLKTISPDGAALGITALNATLEFFVAHASAEQLKSATVKKIKADFAVQVARYNGLVSGTVKAMTPAEKLAAAKLLTEKMQAQAALQAEIAALQGA